MVSQPPTSCDIRGAQVLVTPGTREGGLVTRDTLEQGRTVLFDHEPGSEGAPDQSRYPGEGLSRQL